MDRGLVTLGGTESSAELLREAAEHATGADADLILLSTFTRREYEHDIEVLNRIVGAIVDDRLGRRILSEADGVTSIAYERDPERRLARLRGQSADDYNIAWMGD